MYEILKNILEIGWLAFLAIAIGGLTLIAGTSSDHRQPSHVEPSPMRSDQE